MYAQCPECLTFFRVRPEQLKAAQGKVRCSQCKHVFNALETLRGDLTAEELRAVREARRASDTAADAPLLKESGNGDLFENLEYTTNEELPLASQDEPTIGEASGDDIQVDVDAEPVIEERAAALAGIEESKREDLDEPTGVTERMGDDFDSLPRTEFGRRKPRRSPAMTALLLLVNFLLLGLLAVQFVHHERRQLLQHPEIGGLLAETYAHLGIEIEPRRDLAAIRVNRTNVASHPDFAATLQLTAVVENRAGFPQPWPFLRIDLQDRWGDTVGARYFTPAEYLRDPAKAERLMPADEPQAIELAIADPGADAVGFQLEPCLEMNSRKICANDLR